MGVPARWLFVLALAAAVDDNAAAASDRFVPTDPHFVVANVRQATPDPALRELIALWRAEPDDAASAALGAAFLERAESLRDPMYVGRAESVLAAAANRAGSSAAVRRLYAETLQFRHEFSAAEALLDAILEEAPRDAAARQQRASVRLVRGNFAGARGDCAQLLAGGGVQAIALACLAEAMAGSGQLQQARALLAAYPLRDAEPAAARAYLLTVRAELHERGADPDRAIVDYVAALALVPQADAVRAALVDALMAHGAPHDAAGLLGVERPSLALTVRRAACTHGSERSRLRAQAAAWLDLEAARGDALHYREAAMLALDAGDAARALAAARANFRMQRELPDVRVLARAALAAGDDTARRELEAWMHETGFRDALTEKLLAIPARG
jgi:predicted Zn-dependent protease